MTELNSPYYYFHSMIGGLLACGTTHTAITTVDLLKCLKQVDSSWFSSFKQGFQQIYKLKGFRGVTSGWAPTLIGYSQQGMFKYGFYELFKNLYQNLMQEKAEKYKVLGYALSSASAEIFADIFLCPWESVKVWMQTQVFSDFPQRLRPAMRKIYQEENHKGFTKGLIPLWSRQIPYTVAKFVFFEQIVSMFYTKVFNKKPKQDYPVSTQLFITFSSGYLAGIICAIVSHPADTILSKISNRKSNEALSIQIKKIYSEIGHKGLWQGLSYRILMIGTLTGFQWWIYDSYKSAVGLQTSGGSKK